VNLLLSHLWNKLQNSPQEHKLLFRGSFPVRRYSTGASNHFLDIDCCALTSDFDRFHLSVVVRICHICATGFDQKMSVGEKNFAPYKPTSALRTGRRPLRTVFGTPIVPISRVIRSIHRPRDHWVVGNGSGCRTKYVRLAPGSSDKPDARVNGSARHAPRLSFPKTTGLPAKPSGARWP